MQDILRYFSAKDLIIVAAIFIIAILIFKIRRLKKLLTRETPKLLFPQLNIEIDKNDLRMYLKNEGFFMAQDIKIEDSEVTIDDYGFKVYTILKFEEINTLRPRERVALNIKAFDKENNFLADFTERIIPHLINIPFKIKIFCTNIESRRICIVFDKGNEVFRVESIDFCS